jgi:hypothetical protein
MRAGVFKGKLYKVTKIKGCEEIIVYPHILHYEW